MKHSLPSIVPAIPASGWILSEEGRARAVKLAESLRPYAVDALVSSPEPKAKQTAAIVSGTLAVTFETFDGLQEHDRSNVPFDAGSFEDSMAAFFARPASLVLGRETADQAHARFAAALERVMNLYGGGTLAVVSHGTVISLYVSRVASLDAFRLWSGLGLPSYVVLSFPGGQLQDIVRRIEVTGT